MVKTDITEEDKEEIINMSDDMSYRQIKDAFEKVVDFDYVAFNSYSARIETTNKNILALELQSKNIKKSIWERLFSFSNIDVTYLTLDMYNRIRGIEHD